MSTMPTSLGDGDDGSALIAKGAVWGMVRRLSALQPVESSPQKPKCAPLSSTELDFLDADTQESMGDQMNMVQRNLVGEGRRPMTAGKETTNITLELCAAETHTTALDPFPDTLTRRSIPRLGALRQRASSTFLASVVAPEV